MKKIFAFAVMTSMTACSLVSQQKQKPLCDEFLLYGVNPTCNLTIEAYNAQKVQAQKSKLTIGEIKSKSDGTYCMTYGTKEQMSHLPYDDENPIYGITRPAFTYELPVFCSRPTNE